MERVAGWLLAVGLALSSAAAQAVRTELPPGAVLWNPQDWADGAPRRRDRADRAWRLLVEGRADQAVASLDAEPSLLVREAVAAELLSRLEVGGPLPGAGVLLDWATAQPPRVFVQHPETRATALQPLFDLSRKAADVRRLWHEAEARRVWRLRWIADPAAALADLAKEAAPGPQRAAEALAELGEDDFRRVVRALDQAAGVPPAVWLARAQRDLDARALAEVLAAGSEPQRLRAVELAAGLGVDEAKRVLEPWERDPRLGSAAVMALVPRLLDAGRLDAVRERLADPQRRDATVAALARVAADPVGAARLDALHARLAKAAEWEGWARLRVLLDADPKRRRWPLPAQEGQ
ncbi:MAG: hypothetical protein KatS3mg126_1561 [Lysobacteraceae bacterium]|nr:MAG: hypothetical protein KatS3mg126_1561 [Xanthomonadaceae bacterium]